MPELEGPVEELLQAQQRVESLLNRLAGTVDVIQADIASLSRTSPKSAPVHEQPDGATLDPSAGRRPSTVSKISRASEEGLQSSLERYTFAEDEVYSSEISKTPSRFIAGTLPRSWPATLEARPLTAGPEAVGTADGATLYRGASSLELGPTLAKMDFKRMASEVKAKEFKLVIDPNSTRGMMLDLTCLAVLVHDLISVPLHLAWEELSLNDWTYYAMWFTLAFWTLDLPRNFITGTYQDGQLVLCHRTIARNYLRTWFLVDFMVVSCDWLSVIVGTQAAGFRMLRLAKLGRMLRIVGVMRMLRFVRVMEEIADKMLSETHRLGIRILMILMGIMWLTHLMCCLWYAIGAIDMDDSDTRASWTDILVRDDLHFRDASVGYQYMTSFHWAVAQLTLGAVEIACRNTAERIYNVICLLIGLLFGSALISSLSAAMMQLAERRKDRTMKLRVLRNFLRENGVGSKLANNVQKQVLIKLQLQPPITEDDVVALSLLSSALRTQLRHSLFEKQIMTLPLFRLWTRIDKIIVQRFCADGCHFLHLSAQDDLFSAGDPSNHAYYLDDGVLEYTQEPGTSPLEVKTSQKVKEDSWLSLAAMWVEWIHVGHATALAECKVMTVQAQTVIEAMSRQALICEISLHYGRIFQQRVKTAEPPHASYPSDLEVPFTEYSDLLMSMPKEMQVTIGLVAFDQLTEGRGLYRSAPSDKLLGEVESGKALLMETGSGDIERSVSVVALRIQGRDGLLVQIGKLEEGRRLPACQLPGTKQERGEVALEAMGRLLDSKIPMIAGQVQVEHTSREVKEMESKEYGVNTKYSKTIIHASLLRESSFDAPVWNLSGGPPTEIKRQFTSTTPTRSNSDLRRISLGRSSQIRSSAHDNLEEVRRELLGRDAYFVEHQGKAALYAFLTNSEFERLSTPEAEPLLAQWLEAMGPCQGENNEELMVSEGLHPTAFRSEGSGLGLGTREIFQSKV